MFVILYVNDLLIGCSDSNEESEIVQKLNQRFALKEFGDAKFIIGIEVDYNKAKGEIKIKQAALIKRLVERFNLKETHGVRNPLVLCQDLTLTASHKPFKDKRAYRESSALSCTRLAQHHRTSASASYFCRSILRTRKRCTGERRSESWCT